MSKKVVTYGEKNKASGFQSCYGWLSASLNCVMINTRITIYSLLISKLFCGSNKLTDTVCDFGLKNSATNHNYELCTQSSKTGNQFTTIRHYSK